MRRFPDAPNVIETFTIIAFVALTATPRALAQHESTARRLVEELQSTKTTYRAKNELLKLGKREAHVRRYLAIALPPLIDRGLQSCPPEEGNLNLWRDSCPWHNAVEIAGKLKLAEAAPALTKWVNWRDDGPVGLSLEARLVFYPAARSLIEIGNPAVPAVQDSLGSGSPAEKYRKLAVLCIINTPESKAALRKSLPRESEPGLRKEIERCLTDTPIR